MSSINIAFRVDASAEIGTGHVMRCLTLAEKLKQYGATITFICRQINPALQDLLATKKYPIDLLPNVFSKELNNDYEYSHWLGVDQKTDAMDTLSCLAKQSFDWVIVDHYGIDEYWEGLIKAQAYKLLVIDDLANRKHHCDLLLDQTYGRSPAHYSALVNKSCHLLVGSRFCLLRQEFSIDKKIILSRRNKPTFKTILLMLGGTDPENITLEILKVLEKIEFSHKIITVLSNNAEHAQSLHQKYKDSQNVDINIAPANIAERMLEADLAIGASGTSAWERCALGLPTIAIIQAENQRIIANNLQAEGAISVIEKDEIEEKIRDQLTFWTHSPKAYSSAVEKCLSISDGKGTSRVSNAILSLSALSLREAEENDIDLYFDWLNHTSIREQALNQHKISYQDHQAWFHQKIKSQQCYMYLGMIGKKIIGQVRFDQLEHEQQFEIDIHIAPESQGKGYGRFLLKEAINKLSHTVNAQLLLKALILKSNTASQHCFSANQFSCLGSITEQGKPCYQYQWEG